MHTRSDILIPLNYGNTPAMTPPLSSRGLHRIALVTAIATFPLIFMGGLVTSNHAGMSVPDWPNSYGYNMFLFPPSHWVGGILYEHTHRLMATVIGMLSIILVLWAWRAEIVSLCIGLGRMVTGSMTPATSIPREPHRYLAFVVLAAVIFQGVLGGLRVVLVKLDLAIIHACVAQAFFCLTAYMALVTSTWWEDADRGAGLERTRRVGVLAHRLRDAAPEAVGEYAHPTSKLWPASRAGGNGAPDEEQRPPRRTLRDTSRGLFVLGVITVTAIYLQLIIGATMRHFDAGLAIPDLPWAYGKILPPTTTDGLAAVNHLRAFQLNLDPVTLGQIWLHFAHRIGAVIVSLLVILFAIRALMHRKARGMTIPAVTLLLLLLAQVTLGVLTVYLRKPADVASSHVAVGALVLVTSFVLTARAGRIYFQGREHPSRFTPGTSDSEAPDCPVAREVSQSPLSLVNGATA